MSGTDDYRAAARRSARGQRDAADDSVVILEWIASHGPADPEQIRQGLGAPFDASTTVAARLSDTLHRLGLVQSIGRGPRGARRAVTDAGRSVLSSPRPERVLAELRSRMPDAPVKRSGPSAADYRRVVVTLLDAVELERGHPERGPKITEALMALTRMVGDRA
ncbi:MAG TPA: hypothetical protein VNQ73_16430 [Ilumatobacter sp.]|nr:hypothetical protein [Ilumatobacter sp.]